MSFSEKNPQGIVSRLLATGKVRIEAGRLESMVKERASTGAVLVLLKDVEGFLRLAGSMPKFEGIRVRRREAGFEAGEAPEANEILVFEEELPGPIARVNVDWERLAELATWEPVEQIEEIATYELKA